MKSLRTLSLVALAILIPAVILLFRGGSPDRLEDLPARARADFRSHKQQAFEQMRLGQWEGAEADLLRCLRVFDGDPEIHVGLAKVCMARRLESDPARGEDEEDRLVDRALASLHRALEIDPESVPALMARFHVLHDPSLRRHDPVQALADGEAILRIAPENDAFRRRLTEWRLDRERVPTGGTGPGVHGSHRGPP